MFIFKTGSTLKVLPCSSFLIAFFKWLTVSTKLVVWTRTVVVDILTWSCVYGNFCCCCWIARITAFGLILLICSDIKHILWRNLSPLHVNGKNQSKRNHWKCFVSQQCFEIAHFFDLTVWTDGLNFTVKTGNHVQLVKVSSKQMPKRDVQPVNCPSDNTPIEIRLFIVLAGCYCVGSVVWGKSGQ